MNLSSFMEIHIHSGFVFEYMRDFFIAKVWDFLVLLVDDTYNL
jgi:hypothetical protein